jgi:hypothetical protein
MPISLRRTLTRRDGILILVGAAFMHFFDVFSPLDSAPHAIVIDTAPRPQALVDLHHTETTTLVQATTTTVLAEPSADPSFSPLDLALDSEEFPSTDPTSFIPLERTLDSGLLSTSIVAHAPGWTCTFHSRCPDSSPELDTSQYSEISTCPMGRSSSFPTPRRTFQKSVS